MRSGWDKHPEDGSNDAGVQDLLQRADGRLPPPILVNTESHAGAVAGRQHRPGVGQRGGQGLLTNCRDPVVSGQFHKRSVRADVSNDVDKIRPFRAEQFVRVAINRGDSQIFRKSLGLGGGAIVERDTACPGNLPPRGQLVPGPKTGAQDGKAEFLHRNGNRLADPCRVRLGGFEQRIGRNFSMGGGGRHFAPMQNRSCSVRMKICPWEMAGDAWTFSPSGFLASTLNSGPAAMPVVSPLSPTQ